MKLNFSVILAAISTFLPNGGRLNLNDLNEDTLKQFTVPLPEVEDLSISVVNVAEVRAGPLHLNEVFVNVRRLSLNLDSSVDYSFLDFSYPNLLELNVKLSDYSLEYKDQIFDLLEKNPQIRKFTPIYFPEDSVKMINDLLPNLEELTLQKLEIESGTVQFKQLKHLTFLFCHRPRSVDKLVLPKIESLTMGYVPDMFNTWNTFFKNHQHLKRLQIGIFSNKPMDFTFVKLISQLPNLNEIVIDGTPDINTETVIQITKYHKDLTKFEYKNLDNGQKIVNEKQILQEILGNEWNIQEIYGGLSFEKK